MQIGLKGVEGEPGRHGFPDGLPGDRGDAGLPGDKGYPGIGFNITGPPGYTYLISEELMNDKI